MPTTLRNTDILFNDGSTQSTAGQPTSTALVLSATASASAGAVGTYGWTEITTTPGTTYPASSLGISAGTWRSMTFRSGTIFSGYSGITTTGSLMLRIS